MLDLLGTVMEAIMRLQEGEEEIRVRKGKGKEEKKRLEERSLEASFLYTEGK